MPALVVGGGEGGAHLSVPLLYVLPSIVLSYWYLSDTTRKRGLYHCLL